MRANAQASAAQRRRASMSPPTIERRCRVIFCAGQSHQASDCRVAMSSGANRALIG